MKYVTMFLIYIAWIPETHNYGFRESRVDCVRALLREMVKTSDARTQKNRYR